MKMMKDARPDGEVVAAALATKWTVRAGQDWATKCPFHFSIDASSSLHWDPKTGEYQCFVCQKAGVYKAPE